MYGSDNPETLTQEQKAELSQLTSVAGGLLGMVASKGDAAAQTAVEAAKNEVENNTTLNESDKLKLKILANAMKGCPSTKNPNQCIDQFNAEVHKIFVDAAKRDEPRAYHEVAVPSAGYEGKALEPARNAPIRLTHKQREAIANGAGYVSTFADQWAASARYWEASFLAQPELVDSKVLAGMMNAQVFLATGVSYGASAVEQSMRPDIGKVVTGVVVDQAGEAVANRLPLGKAWAPVVYGVSKQINDSDWMLNLNNSINNLFVVGKKKK